MILCMCPMCQLNLDAYQSRVNGHFKTDFKLPIVFFTQLLGIALGLEPGKLGFGKEIVAAKPVLAAKIKGKAAHHAAAAASSEEADG
jgi:heterodisulfide reductase subunit B